MTGEFNIHKFAAFLKSFWGLLASFTVVLPTIIYFLNTKQIKESVLSEYYIGLPTTFALLVIPFVFLFEDMLSVLSKARSASLSFAVASLLILISFLTLKNIYITNTNYSVRDKNGGQTQVEEAKSGEIRLTTYDGTAKDPIRKEQRVNVAEVVALVLYTFSIMLLTASFAGLGVFFYTKSNGIQVHRS